MPDGQFGYNSVGTWEGTGIYTESQASEQCQGQRVININKRSGGICGGKRENNGYYREYL